MIQIAIDVWNSPKDTATEEYFGKVVVRIADALVSPKEAWQYLLPGQLQIAVVWTPYLDADGERKGAPISLILPADAAPSSISAKAAEAVAAAPPKATAAAPPRATPAPEPVIATGAGAVDDEDVEEIEEIEEASPVGSTKSAAPSDGGKSPPGAAQARAMAALEAQAAAYEDDEDDFEEEEDDEPQEPVYLATKAAAPAVVSAPPKPPAPAQYFEFTHKGGTGNGPKENQDAYFLAKIDEQNAVFGVLDGHGQDNGAIAAQAAAAACKEYLVAHFEELRAAPEAVMHSCFEAAHKAVFKAIKKEEGIFVDPETPEVLVMEMPEEEWPLGFDAADGGTTCSVGALIDGRTLVYAAAGDSCALLGVPLGKRAAAKAGEAESAFKTIELVPEHSPTNLNDWATNLCHTGVHVVFDTGPDMFDDQPKSLLPIFTKDGKGGWEISNATLQKADDMGCGLKTERGDRASVVMTPERGRFSQMMLGVTRSVGDFYHQTYGVTWHPEVVVKDLYDECGSASAACLIVASDGVWDHWEFSESMDALCDPDAAGKPDAGKPLTDKRRVLDFFEETRAKGEEAFGDGADNLTGVVAIFANPGPKPAGTGVAPARPRPGGVPGMPGMPGPQMSDMERDLGDDSGDDFGV